MTHMGRTEQQKPGLVERSHPATVFPFVNATAAL
jgi:hypothetical protein